MEENTICDLTLKLHYALFCFLPQDKTLWKKTAGFEASWENYTVYYWLFSHLCKGKDTKNSEATITASSKALCWISHLYFPILKENFPTA